MPFEQLSLFSNYTNKPLLCEEAEETDSLKYMSFLEISSFLEYYYPKLERVEPEFKDDIEVWKYATKNWVVKVGERNMLTGKNKGIYLVIDYQQNKPNFSGWGTWVFTLKDAKYKLDSIDWKK